MFLGNAPPKFRGLVFFHRIRKPRSEVPQQLGKEPEGKLDRGAVRHANQVVAVLRRPCDRIGRRCTVVEREIGHVVPLHQLAQHEIRADFSSRIDRMQQVGFEPE